jgi:phenylalanyl-tRNA synthetase beta subunit
MKISYNWLQEYFGKPLPNPKDLADLLNIRAFEVEEIEEHDGDSVLEIKITPDRAPDCLSHLGVAREVAVHTKQTLIEKPTETIDGQFDSAYSVMAEEKSVQRYMAREVRNVVVGDSPLELKLKLEAIGQRSINTVVDITNIVMYEIGQPMHAFDADKISGKVITIGAPKNSRITTLDGKEIELTAEDLTIQDETDNLAIAGVKGGNKTEVNSSTKNILLESANFFPVKVRKASKRTGIQTDSSKRFENGLTPMLTEKAITLASQYIKKYASTDTTQFSNIIDVYPRPQPRPYSVGLDIRNVSKKIGIEIGEDKILEILRSLGIKPHKVESVEEIRDLVPQVLNAPYLLGASVLFDSPRMFDCSSLVAYLLGFVGVQIPRTSIDQCVFTKAISKDDLRFGDLVFSNSNDGAIHYETKEFLSGTKFEAGVDHVGMYLGDDQILHSSRHHEKGTVIEKLSESKQFSNIVGYRRAAETDEFPRYVLEIPYERLDLKIEMDIIEEIGRVYGYEHVTPSASDAIAQSAELSVYDKIATIKSHLTDIGFDEVVTYSFQKKGDVAVAKPLAKDKGYMRTDLAKGLTDALDLNFRNKELFAEEIVRIFEIGHVFVGDVEKVLLGIAARSANKKQKSKAVLEEALAYLSEKTGVSFSAVVVDNQEVVEIDLAGILPSINTAYNSLYVLPATPYKPFSPYPFMTRDIAVWAKNIKSKEDIEKVITEHAGDLLVRYDLFDTYATDEKTSYAYRLVFQSDERTLTDDEVNPIMDKIYATLQVESDFEIR